MIKTSKISQAVKKQENTNHNEENIQPIKTDSEWTQTLNLSDKNTKMDIITVFHIFKLLVQTWR